MGVPLLLAATGCGGCPCPPSEAHDVSRAPPPRGGVRGRATVDDGGADDAAEHAEVTEVLEGRASYYADSLAGNSTASGEPYDPSALTAASRDLPFGTRLRVIRVDNGRTVVVRVNDRGPFGDHRRIIDLSRRAAETLDMIRAGVVSVRVEVLAAQD